MSNTYTAAFAQTTKTKSAVCTMAVASMNTNTPTNTAALFTAGTNGALVTKLQALPRGTITATALYLFVSTNGGTTKYLVDSELATAYTYATTTAIPETKFANISESVAMRLEAGASLYVGIGVSATDGIVFTAEATDF